MNNENISINENMPKPMNILKPEDIQTTENIQTSENGSFPQTAPMQPVMYTQPAVYTQPTAYAQSAMYAQPAAYSMPIYSPAKEKIPFKPDVYDLWFAVFTFLLGYLCSRWVFFSWMGWGVALFTIFYLLSTTAYFKLKGVFINKPVVWFWFGTTLLTGLSYALFENIGFVMIRASFLFGSAIYYVIISSGRTILGHTGNYLLLDGLNAGILIPFRNFINQYVSFSFLAKGKKKGRIFPAVTGIAVAFIMLAILTPMLQRADSGGFNIILDFLYNLITFSIFEFLFYAFFAVPIAAYIFGLISGSAHGRYTDTIKQEAAEKKVAALRFVQPATVFIVLGSVCILYLVFIFSQLPYFFSAFTGNRPEGWLVFSEYARHGFFELCTIAAINLLIILFANITSKKQRIESRLLKTYNIILASITLVLIATAFSKMALYIDAYGLTMPRLLPCVFMIFLTIVFAALIVLQKHNFSIVRTALITGALIICIMSLLNPDALVVRYNSNRFINGTLQEYDVNILYRSGRAGVRPALDVFYHTTDMQLKHEISQYLSYQTFNYDMVFYNDISHRQSLELFLSREALTAAATDFTPSSANP